jgi:heme-degrading monooxygenase HmoA
MVLEHAVLQVVPGQEAAFEQAFATAKAVIAGSSGFRTLRLSRCIEDASRYLLLVEWTALEDHTEGFRKSAEYDEWRRLLHHFYDPFPTVDHYSEPTVEV